MKKLLALMLALIMAVGVFAACDTAETQDPTEAPTAAPTEAPTEAPVDENVSVMGKLNKHENGWAQGDQFGNEQFHGVYFNTKVNDAIYAEDWSIEYTPVEDESVILVRDGEEYDISLVGSGMIVKFGKTAYALKFEEWMIGELFPVTDGDMIILSGDFIEKNDGECTIRFETPVYISFAGGNAKFSSEDPRAAE